MKVMPQACGGTKTKPAAPDFPTANSEKRQPGSSVHDRAAAALERASTKSSSKTVHASRPSFIFVLCTRSRARCKPVACRGRAQEKPQKKETGTNPGLSDYFKLMVRLTELDRPCGRTDEPGHPERWLHRRRFQSKSSSPG